MRFTWSIEASDRPGQQLTLLRDTKRGNRPVARIYSVNTVSVTNSDNFLTALGDADVIDINYTTGVPDPDTIKQPVRKAGLPIWVWVLGAYFLLKRG